MNRYAQAGITLEIAKRHAASIVAVTCDPCNDLVEVTPYDDLPEIITIAGGVLETKPPDAIRDRLCMLVEACIKILRYV